MDNLEIIINDEEIFAAEIKISLEKYQILISEFDEDDIVKNTYELIVLTNTIYALKKYMETTAKQRYPKHNFLWKKEKCPEFLSSDNNGEIELYYDRIAEKDNIDALTIHKY